MIRRWNERPLSSQWCPQHFIPTVTVLLSKSVLIVLLHKRNVSSNGLWPGPKLRSLWGQCLRSKQQRDVRWVSSVTDDAWWQNPGGECRNQSSLLVTQRRDPVSSAALWRRLTPESLFLGFAAWLFLDKAFSSPEILKDVTELKDMTSRHP